MTPSPSERCPQCDAQQKFAGTYASPNEDAPCGYHTSELRKELAASREREERLRASLLRMVLLYDSDVEEHHSHGKPTAPSMDRDGLWVTEARRLLSESAEKGA